jgi:hypothetical protein
MATSSEAPLQHTVKLLRQYSIPEAAALCWTAIACVQQYNTMQHSGLYAARDKMLLEWVFQACRCIVKAVNSLIGPLPYCKATQKCMHLVDCSSLSVLRRL